METRISLPAVASARPELRGFRKWEDHNILTGLFRLRQGRFGAFSGRFSAYINALSNNGCRA